MSLQSGTKLVVLLMCLAVALGVYSWWNRYESAHRATQFWGPDNARLIVEDGEVEAMLLQFDPNGSEPASLETLPILPGYSVLSSVDLSDARGMVHLRFALTSDSNYLWDVQLANLVGWKWALRFAQEGREMTVLFTDDFETLGKLMSDSGNVELIACQPMAETLQEYFLSLGLTRDTAIKGASNPSE